MDGEDVNEGLVKTGMPGGMGHLMNEARDRETTEGHANTGEVKKKKWKAYIFLAAAIYTLLLPPASGVWRVIAWVRSVNEATSGLKEWRKSVDQKIESIEGKTSKLPGRVQNSEDEIVSRPVIMGAIGLIDEVKAREKAEKSSYGINYKDLLNYQVCEINEAFGGWGTIGSIPSLGRFLEAENTGNSMKTWCMVIGSFNHSKFPNRIMIVSDEVADRLVFRTDQGVLPVNARVFDEWQSNKDCVNLYDLVREAES